MFIYGDFSRAFYFTYVCDISEAKEVPGWWMQTKKKHPSDMVYA